MTHAPDIAESAARAAEAQISEQLVASHRRKLPGYLSSGGDLARSIQLFNWYPATYAHATWIPPLWSRTLGAEPIRTAIGKSRAGIRLGEALLGVWGLDARPCLDFDGIGSRLALLDPQALDRLVYYAGLARHAEEISQVLERSRVVALRGLLGEVAYRFAMNRASLLAGHLATQPPLAPSPGSDMKTRAIAAGLGMLAACLEGSPPGMLSRLRLKFPRNRSALLVASPGERPIAGYMRLFRKILNQEVAPAWDSLLSAAA